MIKCNQLTLQLGTKRLFDQASATIQPGERVGLIGANGTGKSTLFALLRGALHPDGGELAWPPAWRVAHVAQETPAVERSALDYVLDGDTPLRAAEARIAAASAGGDGVAEADAHTAYADADGYTAAARAETLLLGLGFTLAQTRHGVAAFSGGWRMRLNLAQALMCPSDLLLLDEPTNHLDLDAIVWLEDWLRRYAGTLIVISHDREFLDAICNVMLHIDQLKLTRYGGNYSTFEILRAQQLELQQAGFEKQQQKIAHLQSFITRFKAKASKAKQAQSRIKALEKMEKLAPVQLASGFSFAFREPAAAPNPMLVLEGVDCGYRTAAGDLPIVRGVTLSISNGQRIGLLGANGQGKSTLIKTLARTLAPLSGGVQAGKGLQIGYFAQHQLETLRPQDSALQHLARQAPGAREQEMRNFLGSFNFRNEMATAPIAPFSGGEKARLALALIVWQKPNLLLLDEPTNHLDLETREALTMALAQFEGTLIVVSHDRHLLRATTDQFLLVAGGRLQPFDGDLDDYRNWLLKQAANKRATPTRADNSAEDAAPTANRPATNHKEQRKAAAEDRQRRAQQRKPLRKEIDKIEVRMARLSTDQARLDALLADQAIYSEAKQAQLTQILREQASAHTEQASLEARWLELQTQLEAS